MPTKYKILATLWLLVIALYFLVNSFKVYSIAMNDFSGTYDNLQYRSIISKANAELRAKIFQNTEVHYGDYLPAESMYFTYAIGFILLIYTLWIVGRKETGKESLERQVWRKIRAFFYANMKIISLSLVWIILGIGFIYLRNLIDEYKTEVEVNESIERKEKLQQIIEKSKDLAKQDLNISPDKQKIKNALDLYNQAYKTNISYEVFERDLGNIQKAQEIFADLQDKYELDSKSFNQFYQNLGFQIIDNQQDTLKSINDNKSDLAITSNSPQSNDFKPDTLYLINYAWFGLISLIFIVLIIQNIQRKVKKSRI